MSDANEPLEEKVKRLEAELMRLKVERDKEMTIARTRNLKGWDELSQNEFDAALRNTGVLERIIAQLDRDARGE